VGAESKVSAGVPKKPDKPDESPTFTSQAVAVPPTVSIVTVPAKASVPPPNEFALANVPLTVKVVSAFDDEAVTANATRARTAIAFGKEDPPSVEGTLTVTS
jgi:hypothetical protein